jgi:hypothetical protein
MRIEVTEHNNIKYDNAVYVAGTVFEADEESAKALIESGAAVAAKAEKEPAEAPKTDEAPATPAKAEKPAAQAEKTPKA